MRDNKGVDGGDGAKVVGVCEGEQSEGGAEEIAERKGIIARN